MSDVLDQYFSIIEDPRCACDIKYKLKDILILVMCATLCGQDSLERIVQYGEIKAEYLRKTFGIERTPSKSTLSRVLSTIDAKAVVSSIVSIMREMLGTSGRVVAIDGKAICSTANMKTTQALHILTAYLTENGVTLGQVNVHEKTNEIPLMQDLLQMIQVKGKVVTADAMHCQTETCAKIIEAEGDYLLQVKGNQPDLLDNVKLFMDDMIKTDVNALDYAQTVEKNRGRHEERTCYVSSDVDWFDRKQAWQGLRQFAAIKRLVRKDDKETVEWHYYITSVGEEAEKILLYARDHWKIESMHWQLDYPRTFVIREEAPHSCFYQHSA